MNKSTSRKRVPPKKSGEPERETVSTGPETPATPPIPRRGVRIHDSHDVFRLLARVTNQLVRDEIGEGKAGRIGYLCSVMLSACESVALEDRVKLLEEELAERKKGQRRSAA